MEIFLLAAFLLTSAAACPDQPANVRTWTCAGYLLAGLLLLGLLAVILLDLEAGAWWSGLASRLLGKASLALALGVLTGFACVRLLSGQRRWLVDAPLAVVSPLGMIFWYWFAPGHVSSYVVVFILAAIAAGLAAAAFRSHHQPAHLLTPAGVLYLIGIVALIALGLVVVGRTGALGYTAEYVTHRVGGQALVSIILGGAFGWLARKWWVRTPHHHGAPGMIWAAGALIALPVLAMLAAYGPLLLASLTALKTSFAELQFVPARIGDRAAFEVERDRVIDNLAFLLAYGSKPKMDINYLKLRQILGDKDPRLPARLRGAEEADRLFVTGLAPIVQCIEAARVQMMHPAALQNVLSPVAHQLTRLFEVAKGGQHAPALPAVQSGLVERLNATYTNLAGLVADPGLCPGHRLNRQWPQTIQAATLADGTPAYLLLAVLHFSVGNVEKALAILKEGVDRFPDDVSLVFHYAVFGYYGERDLEEVLALIDRSLILADEGTERIRQGEIRKPLKGLTNADLQALRRRYENGRLVLTNFLAYVSAQAGVREEAAIDLAETNYKLLRGPRSGFLGQPGFRVTLIDTFGYALLASGARRSPPDLDKLRRAKALFEEAKSEAAGLPPRERRQIVVVIDSHARQAAKFLPR